MESWSHELRQRATQLACEIGNMRARFEVAVVHYRLLFSLPRYWDELAKLNWWLLLSDEALGMPERASAEHDKLLVFAELAHMSRRHRELFDGFLECSMLGRPCPGRPGKRVL